MESMQLFGLVVLVSMDSPFRIVELLAHSFLRLALSLSLSQIITVNFQLCQLCNRVSSCGFRRGVKMQTSQRALLLVDSLSATNLYFALSRTHLCILR